MSGIIERAEAALAKSWNARSDTELAALVPELVAALKAARAKAIELPDETIIPIGWGEDCIGAWPSGSGLPYVDPVSAWPKGEVAMPNGDFMPAENARALGLALIAAANAAEQAMN